MSAPVVLVVRHPDHSDEFTVDGEVRIISIDLGSSFDVTKLSMQDREAVLELIASKAEELCGLPTDSKVRIAGFDILDDLLTQLERL